MRIKQAFFPWGLETHIAFVATLDSTTELYLHEQRKISFLQVAL